MEELGFGSLHEEIDMCFELKDLFFAFGNGLGSEGIWRLPFGDRLSTVKYFDQEKSYTFVAMN